MKKAAILRLIHIPFSVLCLLIFTTSCDYFKRSSDTEVIYTVNVEKLEVRNKPDKTSNVIGTVFKGDTIIPTADWNLYYVGFKYKGAKGFVPANFLKGHRIKDMTKVSNRQLGRSATLIRDYLNNYVNWRTGRFWLIYSVLVVASIILIILGEKLENYMYDYYDDERCYKLQFVIDIIGGLFSAVAGIIFKILGEKFEDSYNNIEYSFNKLPFFSAIIGVLYSLVYMFFREDVLQIMFVTKSYWISYGDSWLHWYLWLVSLIGVVGLLYFWIKEFMQYGYRGIITVLYFTFLAIITFNIGLLGGVIAILMVGVWIIISLTTGIKFGTLPNKKEQLSSSERVQRFHEQQEIDRQFKNDLDN
jgi:hypothetical protein